MKINKLKIIHVTHFQRKPQPNRNQYSMERCGKAVRKCLPKYINVKEINMKYYGNGIFEKIKNAYYACKNQNQVNHIMGAIHYLALFMNMKRTIITFHDTTPLWEMRNCNIKKLYQYWFSYWFPVRHCKMVIAISEFTKRELIKYTKCNPEKIVVIHDPISLGFKYCKKSFNINKPVILQIGTAKRKNVDGLIEAIKGINCHLRIIGKVNKNMEMLLKNSNVEYSNDIDISDKQIISEYKNCDIVAFISKYEGFGLPIVEANAIGRPVITSNICSMPEVAGNAACIVNPYDKNDINKGIRNIISSSKYRIRLVNNGFKNVKRFHPGNIAKELENVYLYINRTH